VLLIRLELLLIITQIDGVVAVVVGCSYDVVVYDGYRVGGDVTAVVYIYFDDVCVVVVCGVAVITVGVAVGVVGSVGVVVVVFVIVVAVGGVVAGVVVIGVGIAVAVIADVADVVWPC